MCVLRAEALGDYTSWTLFADRVRRVIWDQRLDSRPAVIAPTMYGAEALLASHVAAARIAELDALDLPPVVPPPATLGIDGVTWLIERRGIRRAWWCDPPEAGRPAGAWLERAVDEFERVLPAHVRVWPRG